MEDKGHLETSSILMDEFKLYKDLVETSQELIWQCDIEGQFTFLNPVFERVFGYSLDEMLGRKFSDFQNPEIAKRDEEFFYCLLNGGELKGYETEAFSKSGKKIHLSATVLFVRDADGKIIAVRGAAQDITERKMIAAAAEEGRLQLKAILEGTPNPIYLVDINSRIILLNDAGAKAIGKEIDQVLGKNCAEYFDDSKISEAIIANDLEVIKSGVAITGEEKISGPEGDRFFLATKSPYRDFEGNIIGVFGISHDITERKLVEQALRDSEKKFSLVFRCAPVLIGITDLVTGKFLEVNEESVRLSGFSRDEIIGNTAYEIGWITIEQRLQLVNIVKNEGRIDNLEVPFKCKDGNLITGIVKGEIIRIAGQDCLLTATVDITERKKTEEALLESERRFRTLFMTLNEGFYLTEIIRNNDGLPVDYRYLEVNSAFEKIVGLKREQIVGKLYTELVPVDTTNWLQNYCRIALTGESTAFDFYSPEYKMYFETFAYKTSDDRISVFVRDVTERRKTENALQNMQKLEALGVLAGGIAHDFNNLLGAIFGYIDLAIESSGGDIQERYLKKGLLAIDRARDLTQQLLTFAKGGAPAKKTDALFPFVYETAQFALSGSRSTCVCNVPDDLWICEFDRNQIGQVIDNIVINAQQAMPDGGTVELSAVNVNTDRTTHPAICPGRYVKISISDHGIGIPPEIVPRIFDPFYTTKPKGHGLGLATCYSIIKKHDGYIDVETVSGKGSTFHIYLQALNSQTVAKTDDDGAIHKGTGTVIIMDDEGLMCEVLGEMLRSFGYSVIETQNGDEALKMLHDPDSGEISLLVLDLTIAGGRGGREIIDEVRVVYPDLTVIVASGYADDPVMASPNEFGFTGSVGKPFTRGDLAMVLERLRKE